MIDGTAPQTEQPPPPDQPVPTGQPPPDQPLESDAPGPSPSSPAGPSAPSSFDAYLQRDRPAAAPSPGTDLNDLSPTGTAADPDRAVGPAHGDATAELRTGGQGGGGRRGSAPEGGDGPPDTGAGAGAGMAAGEPAAPGGPDSGPAGADPTADHAAGPDAGPAAADLTADSSTGPDSGPAGPDPTADRAPAGPDALTAGADPAAEPAATGRGSDDPPADVQAAEVTGLAPERAPDPSPGTSDQGDWLSRRMEAAREMAAGHHEAVAAHAGALGDAARAVAPEAVANVERGASRVAAWFRPGGAPFEATDGLLNPNRAEHPVAATVMDNLKARGDHLVEGVATLAKQGAEARADALYYTLHPDEPGAAGKRDAAVRHIAGESIRLVEGAVEGVGHMAVRVADAASTIARHVAEPGQPGADVEIANALTDLVMDVPQLILAVDGMSGVVDGLEGVAVAATRNVGRTTTGATAGAEGALARTTTAGEAVIDTTAPAGATAAESAATRTAGREAAATDAPAADASPARATEATTAAVREVESTAPVESTAADLSPADAPTASPGPLAAWEVDATAPAGVTAAESATARTAGRELATTDAPAAAGPPRATEAPTVAPREVDAAVPADSTAVDVSPADAATASPGSPAAREVVADEAPSGLDRWAEGVERHGAHDIDGVDATPVEIEPPARDVADMSLDELVADQRADLEGDRALSRSDQVRHDDGPAEPGSLLDPVDSEPTYGPEGKIVKPAEAKGTWTGTEADSRFVPHVPAEFGLEPGQSIPFREGVPDLGELTVPTPAGGPGSFHVDGLDGRWRHDFALADKALGSEAGMTAAEVAAWRSANGLTYHHYAGTELQLVPKAVHEPLHHQGSASELRWPAPRKLR